MNKITLFWFNITGFWGLSFFVMSCTITSTKARLTTPALEIQPITQNAFIHLSYLDIPNYGKFPCNGMVYVKRGEAIVFDTPLDDSTSYQLINWIEKILKAEIKAVVVNHFHDDCLAGLQAFHNEGIPSYATNKTIQLAKKKGEIIPQHGFEEEKILEIGGEPIHNRFFGPAHAPDNIVSWIPGERLVFGGCMIKSLGSGKGNLADADTIQWPLTVQKIKDAYQQTKVVVPGHGAHGGQDLFDYTIKMFSKNE